MLLMFVAPIETLFAVPQNLNINGNDLPWFILMINLLTVGILLLTIFQFKNRNLQKRLCYGSVVLVGITFLLAFFGAAAVVNNIKVIGVAYKWGLSLPLISIVLIFLALTGIIKDDKLIRSADRLR
jgi:heme A synthase